MPVKNFTTTLLLPTVICATALFWPVAVAAQSDFITIRATSAVPDAVIDYVARSSEPTPRRLRPNQKPEDLITSRCYVRTATFEKVFYELNQKNLAQGDAQSVRMPACFKWRRNFPVNVLPGDTLDAV